MKVAMKLVGINDTCALSGGNSSNALGSRAKFHRRMSDQSVRCASEAASSVLDMWKGVRSHPLVVLTSINRARPAGVKLAMS